jgi:cobalt/nickel transport system ATP-binding protein
MTEPVIELKDVSYSYADGSVALEHVNLQIMKGERVAIVGPNGAGKSTLLMLISGLFTPSIGSINIFGSPINKKDLLKTRSKIGLVFQEPDDQLFCPSLWEDVIFGPMNMRLSEGEVIRRANEALRIVGLENYKERPPHHLSAGEKKKAAIATVLAMRPEIFLLDEPTANLDPASRSELVSLINRLHRDGATVVTATHDVNTVPAIADKIYILSKGKILAEGRVTEVFSRSEIMKEAKLELPIATLLFKLLAEEKGLEIAQLPLTVEEALHEINRVIEQAKLRS